MIELQEIPLPPAPPWTPQTAGWAVVAALALAALAWGSWRAWRRYRANAYRRDALRELAEIERAGELSLLPALLKRCALAIAPRDQVASLSGDPWLAWLDARCPAAGFSAAPGRTLLGIAYASRDARVDADQAGALLRAARTWVRGHRARV